MNIEIKRSKTLINYKYAINKLEKKVQKIIQPREIRVTYWFADEYKYLVSVPEFGGDYKWLSNDEIQGMFTKLPIEYKLSLISKFGGWWYTLHKKIYFTLLFEASQPYKKFDKEITFRLNGVRQGHEGISIKEKMIPLVRREPELIHGIRNIIHNAIKFAKTTVDINLICTLKELNVEIVDNGRGFPPDVKKMIGEPFLKNSDFYSTEEKTKTPLEGMGLGLFIANILLEKTNAQLKFSNVKKIENDGKKRIKGAKVEILWERSSIEVLQLDKRAKVKENPRNVS